MKTVIKEILPLAVAFLMTGSIANAMAPVQTTTISKVEPVKTVTIVKKAPVIVTPPAPVKVITWQDNPQHCTPEQYISAEEPFNCINKQIPTSTHQTPQASSHAATGTHEDWMAAAGISSDDYQYVDYIIRRESGWSPNAVNAASGATGVCQSLPASKMASAGDDYMTNPVTQLKWCNSYAIGRYGGWNIAESFWMQHSWW